MHRIGIRREDKNPWERRVPLTPNDARAVRDADGVAFAIQPSSLRVFPDSDYREAAVTVSEDLSDCGVILAVKEIPVEQIESGHAYVFFSHTIKGQPQGMPLLRKVLDTGATLIDYERITDDQGRRLVAFGRYAGLAGMIDGLWALGRRWQAKGVDSSLLGLEQAASYPDLDTALAAVAEVGAAISQQGLPGEVSPLVVGVTGYGNVASGALEVLDRLPRVDVTPEALDPTYVGNASDRQVHVAVFTESHTVRRRDGGVFDVSEFRADPQAFESRFADFLPQLSIVVNSVYWDQRSPRLISIADLADAQRLDVIADLSCDIDGGVEATVRATDTGSPVFTFDPATGQDEPGFEGPGVTILAVDNLPCELPLDASAAFSAALRPMLLPLASADYSSAYVDLELPPQVKRAVIAHRGRLAPGYGYLAEALAASDNRVVPVDS